MSEYENMRKLYNLTENVNWLDESQRREFLHKLYPLIRNWKTQLPNLRQFIRPEIIEYLLSDSIRNYDSNIHLCPLLISFVAASGYKDRSNHMVNRNTPIHLAARYKYYNLFSNLFKIYDRFDVSYMDDSGLTHFHVACMSGCEELVREFLRFGRNPNHCWRETGDSPLHMAVEAYERNKVVELLLRCGANPNIANAKGATPLHIICKKRYNNYLLNMLFHICRERNQPLLVNAQDDEGDTPLHLSLLHGLDTTAELLLLKGADPILRNKKGSTALHLICSGNNDHTDLLETIFAISDLVQRTLQVDPQDRLRNTPLHYALDGHHKSQAEFLMMRGANLNLANIKGSTPLHIICQRNYTLDLLEALFEISDGSGQQLNIDPKDRLGRTPLQWAVAALKPDQVDVLLNQGADVSSFEFPTEKYFATNYRVQIDGINFKLEMASAALAVVTRLVIGGYKLKQADALIIMNTFAKHGVFEKSADLQRTWCQNEEVMHKAKTTMMKAHGPSLYELIQMRPEEAERKLAYMDYVEFERENELWKLPRESWGPCISLLCERLTTGFVRRWALDPLLNLTGFCLPIECCDLIIKKLENVDLYHVCLVGHSIEDNEKKKKANIIQSINQRLQLVKRARI